jgi:hypothetical protein
MGLIRKVASIMMLGGLSSHTRREPPGKAERARAKAERAQEKAAQAQAVRAEAEAKVAEEQAAALARALHEDEAHRQADLREVAENRGRGPAGVATRPLTAARRAGPTLTAWVTMMRRTTWNTPATSPGRWRADGECHRPSGRCRRFPRLARNRAWTAWRRPPELVDTEARRIIEECYEQALATLRGSRDRLDRLAHTLMDRKPWTKTRRTPQQAPAATPPPPAARQENHRGTRNGGVWRLTRPAGPGPG